MFGLTRIALHNSYFSGLTVMFETDGHSNASGGNGAGKTSALNLIPIFYGTEPNQLVDQVADKDSFLDFYLPKQSSALIYEHLREDGHRLVVMYRHNSGAKTLYRFVQGSLEETFFHPEIKVLLERGEAISDIFHALGDRGIRYTRQIDTITDYRTVIQNDRNLMRRGGRNNAAFRAMAREYCLGGPNDHMSHLDRMSYSILRRTDMYERLKRMIAETQFDIHIDERPEYLKDKTLIDDIAGLRDFDTAEPRIRDCITSHQQRKLVIADRDGTAAQLIARCMEAIEHIDALEESCNETSAALTTLNQTYTEESLKLRRIHDGLKSEVEQLQNDIDVIYAKHYEWQDWDITQKQAEYDNLEHQLSRQLALEADYKLLTEKVANLQQAQQTAEAKAKGDRDDALQLCSAKRLELTGKQTDIVRDHATLREDLARREQDELEQLVVGDIAIERNALNQALIEARQHAKRCQISEEDQLALDDLEQQVGALVLTIEDAAKSVGQCRNAFEQQKTRHQGALGAHQDAVREHQRIQVSYDQVRELVFPKDNSLLSALRSMNPEWAETVGKVVNPDLLTRSDLQPDFDPDASGALYGWSLALAKIDTPDYAANEESLQARLDEAASRLRVAQQLCEDREQDAAELFKEIKPLQLALTQAEHVHQQHEEQAKVLRDRYRTEKKQAQAKALQQQEEHKAQAGQLQKALGDLDSRIEQRREEIKSAFNTERGEINAREQMAAQQIDAKLAQLDGEVEQIQSDYTQRIKTINLRFSEECEREGVDPAKISTSRQAAEEQKVKVGKIQGYLPKLQEHEHWALSYWAQVPEKEQRLSDKRTRSVSAADDISIHNRKHNAQKKELERRLGEYQKSLGDLNRSVESANKLLSRCPTVEADPAPVASLLDLTEALSRLLADEDRLRKQVLEGVGKAQLILNKYVNSRIYKAWETLLEQRRQLAHADEYEESFRLQQPDDLSHLLDEDLPAIRDILIQQLRAVGDSLSKYHDCLKGLNEEVARVSRHLGQKVNTNQRIENLSNIELQVTSIVVEGDYWDKLSSFNQLWKEWQDGRDVELPPESLLYAIQSANEAIQGARISNDINSLIRLRISLEENGRKAHVSNAREFDALSSNGLSYLAILVIFIGMARYLCPNNKIALHWPIDELAALSPENIARLFRMLDEAGLYCFSAFPSTDPNLLKFFKHRKLIDRRRGIRNLSDQVPAEQGALREKLNGLIELQEV